MAAVALQPLPVSSLLSNTMSSRRVPLATNRAAVNNSPLKSTSTNTLNTKRARSQYTNDQLDSQSPPKKKLAVEVSNESLTSRRAQRPVGVEELDACHARKKQHHEQSHRSTAERRTATRDSTRQKTVAAAAAAAAEKADGIAQDIETIRQWRRHYKKIFPQFVFYFESLAQDICIRSSRQIASLSASEEKFFSRAVTHVVTSRPIPAVAGESLKQTSRRAAVAEPTQPSMALEEPTSTINPSLLEKSGKHVLDQALQRRSEQLSWHEPDNSRKQNADVLTKARELGIKIWSLEKFERVMETMFDPNLEPLEAKKGGTREGRETQLTELVKQEKDHQAHQSLWNDVVALRGYYLYVHDMDEKTRPSMVREYNKVQHKEDGEWPQFRSVPIPRCPFVEGEYDKCGDRKKPKKADAATEEKVKRQEREQQQQQPQPQPRTRAASAALELAKEMPDAVPGVCVQTGLKASGDAGNRMVKPAVPAGKMFERPQLKTQASGSLDGMPPQFSAAQFNFQGIARPGREPEASGIQKSNITSAIKSQMISSTAAGPSLKAGMTKEMHHLQRRAVERRSGLNPNQNASIAASYMNDMRAALNKEQQPTARRPGRGKVTNTMNKIMEDETESDVATRAPKKKRSPPRREPKPGYCENCKDKYDDFSEHIESRKHRKFAIASENFLELDDLLKKLARH